MSTTSGDLSVKIAKTRPVTTLGAESGISNSEGLTDQRRAGHERGGVQHPGSGRAGVPVRIHHRGLMNAIEATMARRCRQRCRVTLYSQRSSTRPKGQADMVVAAAR